MKLLEENETRVRFCYKPVGFLCSCLAPECARVRYIRKQCNTGQLILRRTTLLRCGRSRFESRAGEIQDNVVNVSSELCCSGAKSRR